MLTPLSSSPLSNYPSSIPIGKISPSPIESGNKSFTEWCVNSDAKNPFYFRQFLAGSIALIAVGFLALGIKMSGAILSWVRGKRLP